jgi:hypothetical protein
MTAGLAQFLEGAFRSPADLPPLNTKVQLSCLHVHGSFSFKKVFSG